MTIRIALLLCLFSVNAFAGSNCKGQATITYGRSCAALGVAQRTVTATVSNNSEIQLFSESGAAIFRELSLPGGEYFDDKDYYTYGIIDRVSYSVTATSDQSYVFEIQGYYPTLGGDDVCTSVYSGTVVCN